DERTLTPDSSPLQVRIRCSPQRTEDPGGGDMTLLRAALEATLTNRPFVEDELLTALPAGTRPPAGTPIALRLIDLEDRDEVTAEVRTVENSTLLLHGFAQEEDAEHTFRVMEELCDAGFDEGNRYRVYRPLALMREDCLVVSSGRPGTSVAELVDRDRKSTRLNSSHRTISYAVFCLKKKKKKQIDTIQKIFTFNP